MQGVRWSEEDLKAHQARRASLRVVPPAPVAVPTSAVAPPPKRKIRRPEQELHKDAVTFLNAALPPTWRVIHVPNGGQRSPVEAAIMKGMGVRSGFPDLGIIGPGRFVVGEAKAGRGKLSDDQAEWRDWFQSIGVPWFLFRSHEELVAGCLDAGVPLRVRA